MKFLSLISLSAAACALSIQPRQFGGFFRGPPSFTNGDIINGDIPQNDVNNGANQGAGNGANNGNLPQDNPQGGANQDNGNGEGNGANGGNNDGQGSDGGQGNDGGQGAGDATGGGDAATADGQTVVFTEVNGVPGNECLTFRNNGEIVDAACVNTAADRQVTPSTVNGQSALQVQRTFTAGFRPDLVDVQACIGFNGTHFRAEDCNAQGVEPVTFQNGQLVASGGACASGHDDLAQMTVDTSGAQCATYTTTDVQPAAA
ncbi:hypothetical protein ACKRZS_012674 [Fusarium odoratissimum]|uniref:Uncharacterized protein n=4 Tax=Fusarium oxysporum species complex TaxID=171631 RepID=A0A0J9VHK8_FUSO4|nr:hypothetical protein FOXG_20386 [Fusarium oxysporum f. sp. lycopersici 4287]XP_031052281.1 uncharacterized protein FOIG_16549 [Fusarium odoratissimum NRRL 54006]EXK46310.1 hypothetical protein FOMG_00036 [Fusarium oxysporum f. sp. melonis 26406]KAJ9429848.1 hypothetical protein QL093DRAFT_2173970 [Fusarium oxysporum]KAK2138007.1 hypothetical protein NOF04DRAFT_22408 [Fusarium oxysporum II5]TXC03758.1 hypothetical protein FocTR4_00002281 [Fusarium oxysporum f. sp. cubense]EXL90191.1 hypothe